MPNAKPTIFVVDDEQPVRDSLRWLLEPLQFHIETYASARDFLSAYDPARPGCLVLDVRMPRMSGLELQEELNARQIRIPIIIITGHGDVPMAVRAMKAGAVDFVEKPFNEQTLLERIQHALDTDARERREEVERQAVLERIGALTSRERDVLTRVVAGKSNKLVAAELSVSTKTVEAHRHNIMQKLGAH
jgi:FixJ family two-component response regulator